MEILESKIEKHEFLDKLQTKSNKDDTEMLMRYIEVIQKQLI